MSLQVFRSKNGSSTLLDSRIGETMHSALGPWREANDVYVAQSEKQLEQTCITLYDMGMGIAANSLALIASLKGSSKSISIISFETDLSSIQLALTCPSEFEFLVPFEQNLRHLIQNGTVKFQIEYQDQTVKVEWTMISKDFRVALQDSPLPPPDLIYYDLYSPKSSPELWTEECFRLFQTKKNTSLITYSAAGSVRRALRAAGFCVGIGNPTEMKRETTVASMNPHLISRPWKGLGQAGGKGDAPQV